MKKFFLSMLAIAALTIQSCGDDDDSNGGPDPIDNEISGQITSDLRLTNDRIWTLNGRTTVTNGAELFIEPGTIIKALPGQGANASVLIIARGSTINANGSAGEPIVFTSITDNIQVGETAGTNLDENDRGLWGGVIVLGNAPSSFRGDASEEQIEGIPANDTNGRYGGTAEDDNSGVLNYVSIRHGGTNIGEGNEINGLTLGGVGRGTTISNIEVVANVDDGIEFFGGTVNATNLFVWAVGDDAIDIDQAYSGTIDNAGIVLGNISDHALEIDGPEGSMDGAFTLRNVTMFGNLDTANGEYADYRSNAQGSTSNVYATGFNDDSDIELDNNAVSQNYLDGELTFSSWVLNVADDATAASKFVEKVGCAQNCDDEDDVNNDDIDEPFITDFTVDASSFASAGTTGGADTSAFAWTYSNNTANLGF
ncbi:hypothetical protein BST97_09515 [Nonlabens spongiae]|uniref:Multidrug transporter n=1 Tax=Nonlabens spongiae TaxID=331648 RepID=A0A1W6MKT4_9FLAO|nr:hypothetical protein [Nonlabens spongiae]ARN78210.1 hypothetical protein BST97_09515 [Nonlabens spongiae]